MRFPTKWRMAAFVGALAGSAGLVAAATGATGAYFDAVNSGTVTGTIGQVAILTTGGNGNSGSTASLDFQFANLMPGTFQTATVKFQNTGTNAEDIWLVFPNADALHALNNLGRYGGVTVQSTLGVVFKSSNLNDALDSTLAPDGNCPGTPDTTTETFWSTSSDCLPLPNAIELASNVAGQGTGTMEFSFAYAPKLKGPGAEGATAFCYPLVQIPSDSNPADQTCTTTGPKYGLPYQIVATQPGIAPNDPLNSVVTP